MVLQGNGIQERLVLNVTLVSITSKICCYFSGTFFTRLLAHIVEVGVLRASFISYMYFMIKYKILLHDEKQK